MQHSARPEPANEPCLHPMRQDDIARENKTKRDTKSRRTWDESRESAEPREWERYPDCRNDDGRRDQRVARSAFQKRNLRGANDMDSKRVTPSLRTCAAIDLSRDSQTGRLPASSPTSAPTAAATGDAENE